MKFNSSKLLFLIPAFVFAVIIIGTSGCNDSGVVEPPPAAYDSNVVIYKGVAAFYWFRGTNDTSYMGVDLWLGDSVRQISTTKDMELIDNMNDTTNFYFRSGDLSQILIGFKARFNRIYDNAGGSSFDTLSVIPDSNQLLDSLDFTSDDTYNNGAWPYFTIGQAEKPVYSFYLSGKFANGTTGGHRVYGVFQVKSIEKIRSTLPEPEGSFGIIVLLDIKLNKVGINHLVH